MEPNSTQSETFRPLTPKNNNNNSNNSNNLDPVIKATLIARDDVRLITADRKGLRGRSTSFDVGVLLCFFLGCLFCFVVVFFFLLVLRLGISPSKRKANIRKRERERERERKHHLIPTRASGVMRRTGTSISFTDQKTRDLRGPRGPSPPPRPPSLVASRTPGIRNSVQPWPDR